MSKTRAYKIEFDPELMTTKINRSGRVCMGYKLMRSNATKVLKSDVLDTCGVYLLLSDRSDGTRAVYVGEAESVHDRLKQHCAKPPFDWDEAIGFVSLNEDWEKSNIKYMEHGLYERLADAAVYDLKNDNTPKQSKVFSPDVWDEQIDEIKELVGYLGYPKLFKKVEKVLLPETPKVSKKPLKFLYKSAKMFRAVFVEMFKRGLIDDDDIKFLASKDSAKEYKTGGYEMIRKDVGDINVLRGRNGIQFRYYQDILLPYGRSKYYLSSQLYDKSIPALLKFAAEKGLSEAMVMAICDKAYAK